MARKQFRIMERPDLVGIPTMFYVELADDVVPEGQTPILMVTVDFQSCETVHEFIKRLYGVADALSEAAIKWDKAADEIRAERVVN